MSIIDHLGSLLVIFGLPALLMLLIWRRGRKVRAVRAAHAPSVQPTETLRVDGSGHLVGAADAPNEALIGLGAQARESRWPLP